MTIKLMQPSSTPQPERVAAIPPRVLEQLSFLAPVESGAELTEIAVHVLPRNLSCLRSNLAWIALLLAQSACGLVGSFHKGRKPSTAISSSQHGF